MSGGGGLILGGPRNRADLFGYPIWALLGLDADPAGNPCVWLNHYEDGDRTWSDTWSCQCDDDGVSPTSSEWLGPASANEYIRWDNLPEAGAAAVTQTAVEAEA